MATKLVERGWIQQNPTENLKLICEMVFRNQHHVNATTLLLNISSADAIVLHEGLEAIGKTAKNASQMIEKTFAQLTQE